jgi:nitrate/nitrite-specific signal transduction histidine kinase
VKEALNNAAKYSEATELFLRIHCSGHVVEVIVEDNGRGFATPVSDGEHNGLNNMVQRMQSLGGDCRVTSKPGAGCRVDFRMPLRHSGVRAPWFGGPKPRPEALAPAPKAPASIARPVPHDSKKA